jgi:hypothetical protein
MDQTQLATLVDRLTGRLVPAFGSTRAQLDQLKRELARALRWQPLEEFTAGGLGLPELIDPEPEAGRAAAGEPSPESMDIANAVFGIPFQAGHERMAFRRDVPAVTSGRAASTPLWAAGQRIDRTLGPFTDHTGKTYWFDFFSALPFTRILRGTDLILLVPLPDGLAPEDAYALAAGTVWIKSRLLTPTAPAGAFTALRIHEGRIAFVPAATAAGGMFVLGTGDECELLLALDPPVHAHAVDTATGDDAEGAAAQPPGHVRIVVRPSRATIVEAGEMRARMFGRNYHFRMNGQPPVFEPLLNRVLVPFDGTESSVSAPTVASALFRISGKAEAMANAWALPVTVTSADRLGAAAGVGAIVIRAGPGLRAAA